MKIGKRGRPKGKRPKWDYGTPEMMARKEVERIIEGKPDFQPPKRLSTPYRRRVK